MLQYNDAKGYGGKSLNKQVRWEKKRLRARLIDDEMGKDWTAIEIQKGDPLSRSSEY